MEDFLQTVLSFPTVVYTTGLGIVLVYWLTVILGALDIDAFGLDADLDLDADVGGAAEVSGEAADVPDGADVAEGADGGQGGGSGLAAILTALRLRHAPLTVTLSVVLLAGWVWSYVGARALLPLLPLPVGIGAALVGLAAFALALPVASVLTRPLGPLFILHQGKSNQSFVGSVCTVRTGRVDSQGGQALIEDGGAGLLVRVRCDDAQALGRGDEALIIGYHPDEDVFDVEPLRALLPPSDGRTSDS